MGEGGGREEKGRPFLSFFRFHLSPFSQKRLILRLSYPDVSLVMKMCAQRKARRKQRARRLADLVFKMAGQYAIFKISLALFICEF